MKDKVKKPLRWLLLLYPILALILTVKTFNPFNPLILVTPFNLSSTTSPGNLPS